MNSDVLTTRVTDGIAVVTLGSAKRIYFDAKMGDALTEALDRFAGDAKVRVVVVTGGAPGYFNRHFNIPALIEIGESLRASGRQWPETALTWPEAQQRIQALLARGLQREVDFEKRWPAVLGTLLET